MSAQTQDQIELILASALVPVRLTEVSPNVYVSPKPIPPEVLDDIARMAGASEVNLDKSRHVIQVKGQ